VGPTLQHKTPKAPARNSAFFLPLSPLHAPPPSMDAGECSTSNQPQQCSTSASSPPAPGASVWAKLGDRPSRSSFATAYGFLLLHGFLILLLGFLGAFPAVPSDSAFPEVGVAEDDAVVCSLVSPSGGEELAWCEIRRGGDASSATIQNLRYFDSSRFRRVRIAGKTWLLGGFTVLLRCPVL
jgi:hypothetical protein